LAVTDRAKAPDLKYSGALFLLIGRANGLAFNRLGVTITKKASPRAVDRNRVKRIVREFFRLNTAAWPQGFDLVFIARANAAAAPRQNLWDDLNGISHRLV
jgi:ribonuclease P protein component